MKIPSSREWGEELLTRWAAFSTSLQSMILFDAILLLILMILWSAMMGGM